MQIVYCGACRLCYAEFSMGALVTRGVIRNLNPPSCVMVIVDLAFSIRSAVVFARLSGCSATCICPTKVANASFTSICSTKVGQQVTSFIFFLQCNVACE